MHVPGNNKFIRETNILPGLTGCWDHLAFVIIVKGMAHSKVGRN